MSRGTERARTRSSSPVGCSSYAAPVRAKWVFPPDVFPPDGRDELLMCAPIRAPMPAAAASSRSRARTTTVPRLLPRSMRRRLSHWARIRGRTTQVPEMPVRSMCHPCIVTTDGRPDLSLKGSGSVCGRPRTRPPFPGRFGSIEHSRTCSDPFFDGYNRNYHHSALGLHMPSGCTTTAQPQCVSSARPCSAPPTRPVQNASFA